MCTVSIWPRESGYLLGMNRDEQRTRATASGPETRRVGDVGVVHPREPGGGTWIATNDGGATFALVNWYAIAPRDRGPRRSRGDVVIAASDCPGVEAASRRLGSEDLERVHPFRLVGVFLEERRILEWCWDQRSLVVHEHGWEPRQWISSGFDEPGARRSRSAVFAARMRDADRGSVGWLRRLHASHDPEAGPYSTCMHRPDAATVSYTEVEVSRDGRRMDYFHGEPCRAEFGSHGFPDAGRDGGSCAGRGRAS